MTVSGCLKLLTLSCPVKIKRFAPKQLDRMWLCACNSGAESGRELFKGSKNGASSSLHANLFWLEGADFL